MAIQYTNPTDFSGGFRAANPNPTGVSDSFFPNINYYYGPHDSLAAGISFTQQFFGSSQAIPEGATFAVRENNTLVEYWYINNTWELKQPAVNNTGDVYGPYDNIVEAFQVLSALNKLNPGQIVGINFEIGGVKSVIDFVVNTNADGFYTKQVGILKGPYVNVPSVDEYIRNDSGSIALSTSPAKGDSLCNYFRDKFNLTGNSSNIQCQIPNGMEIQVVQYEDTPYSYIFKYSKTQTNKGDEGFVLNIGSSTGIIIQ